MDECSVVTPFGPWLLASGNGNIAAAAGREQDVRRAKKYINYGTAAAQKRVSCGPEDRGQDVVHGRMSDTCVKSRFGGPPLTTCPGDPSKQPHDAEVHSIITPEQLTSSPAHPPTTTPYLATAAAGALRKAAPLPRFSRG